MSQQLQGNPRHHPARQPFASEPAKIPDAVPIQPSANYVEHLRALKHSEHTLRAAGYVLWQLTESELERKKRCQRCCLVLNKKDRAARRSESAVASSPSGAFVPPRPILSQSGSTAALSSGFSRTSYTTSSHTDSTNPNSSGLSRSIGIGEDIDELPNHTSPGNILQLRPKIIHRCKCHPGRVAFKKWTCCNGHIFAKPCAGYADHVPRLYAPTEMQQNWFFHPTPLPKSGTEISLAVAIDCEMGVAESGESELIRVSAVDYISGKVLVNSLVWPDVKMTHYNTRFSGVTKPAMVEAKQRGNCIMGRANARNAIWKHVGPETIIIGHALQNDLVSLRWMHTNVVDTLLLETKFQAKQNGQRQLHSMAEAQATDQVTDQAAKEFQGECDTVATAAKPGLSLKAAARERLGRAIQAKGRGHDSLEDAIATRDVLHWHVERAIKCHAT